MRVRRILLVALLMAVAAACDAPMTATEYVDALNVLIATARSDIEASIVAYDQLSEPTLAESVAFIEREVDIRREFRQGFEALDPPESLAEVHQVLGDALDRLLAAAEGVVAAGDSVGSVEEAEQTPEFAEYLAANADGLSVCLGMQALLDDLEASGAAFDDAPWVPNDVALAVRAALGCEPIPSG